MQRMRLSEKSKFVDKAYWKRLLNTFAYFFSSICFKFNVATTSCQAMSSLDPGGKGQPFTSRETAI